MDLARFPGESLGWRVDDRPRVLRGWLPSYSGGRIQGGKLAWIVQLPLWIPFLLFALPTALLWYLDRRRYPAGRCQRCGYDLTGNVSGRCPECGTPIKPEGKKG